MEYLDVLDKNGNKTGQTKSKDDVHTDGDWHRAVHIWILNPRNELLIQKRSSAVMNNPNLWDMSAAGHVSAGEDSITSALREVEEEIGVKLHKEQFQHFLTVIEQAVLNNGTYINNETCDVYLVRIDFDISDIVMQEDEVAEVKIIDFRDLKKKVLDEGNNFVPHQEEYEKLFEYLEKEIK